MGRTAKLIAMLRQITSNTAIEVSQHGNLSGLLIDQIEEEAGKVLITRNGRPDFDAINEVREAGYSIFPGDKDSFGWLTLCIRVSRGLIVIG
ncbi:hypothetical protein D3C71_1317320 [compost metagenome]